MLVHLEPTASPSETVVDQIHYLAELQGVHAHDIHVREVSGQLEADFDLEVQSEELTRRKQTHATSSHDQAACPSYSEGTHGFATEWDAIPATAGGQSL